MQYNSESKRKMQDISDRVHAAIQKLNLSIDDIAVHVFHIFEVSTPTAKGYVYDLKGGARYKFTEGPNAREKRLQRYAIILYALGIDECDELIRDIRSLYVNFQYPPPENMRVKLSAKHIEHNYNMKYLTLSDKINRLNATDIELLNRIVDGLLAVSKNSPPAKY